MHRINWKKMSLGGGSALVAAAALLAGVGPAGAAPAPADNGIGSLSAKAALAESAKALGQVPNLVIAGTISQGTATLDLSVSSADHGAAAEGTLDSHAASLGFFGSVRFVTVGGSFYLNGGSTFWSRIFAGESGLTAAERAKVLAVIVNRWIELPGSEAKSMESDFSTFIKPAGFATELTHPGGTLSKGTPKVVHGVEALPIISSQGGTLWLSLSGQPLPLELTGGSSSSHGDLTLSYPASLVVHAPAGAKTLTQIEQQVS